MSEIGTIFSNRFKECLERRGWKSGRQFLISIGVPPATFYSITNKRIVPVGETILKIAYGLGVTPNYLLGYDDKLALNRVKKSQTVIDEAAATLLEEMMRSASSQLESMGIAPDFKDILSWWRENDGVLKNMKALGTYVDTFHIPDASECRLKPLSIGNDSLAAKSLGSPNPALLQEFMETLSPEVREKIVFSYFEAKNRSPEQGIILTEHTMRIDVPGMTSPLDLHYWKLMLPVRDARGNEYILNYSAETPSL